MLVKIISSCNQQNWYNNLIGEVFDVTQEDESDTYYIVKTTEYHDIYLCIDSKDVVIFDRNKKIQKIVDRNKNIH